MYDKLEKPKVLIVQVCSDEYVSQSSWWLCFCNVWQLQEGRTVMTLLHMLSMCCCLFTTAPLLCDSHPPPNATGMPKDNLIYILSCHWSTLGCYIYFCNLWLTCSMENDRSCTTFGKRENKRSRHVQIFIFNPKLKCLWIAIPQNLWFPTTPRSGSETMIQRCGGMQAVI